MRSLLVLAVLCISPAARASDVLPLVSAPLALGADHHLGYDTDTKFAIGWRPELIVAYDPKYDGHAVGLGIYGEVEHAGADWLGGGAAAAYYFDPIAVTVSAGVDRRTFDGTSRLTSVFGAFFGVRSCQGEMNEAGWPVDIPIGVRVDVRPGAYELPTSLMFQLQLDVPGIAAFFVYLAKHPEFGH